MSRAYRYLVLTFALAFCTGIVSAQVPTGTPPFGSFGGGPDTVDLANLNVHLAIQVIHKPGRGTNFTYDLNYESSIWAPVTSGPTTTWQPITGLWGWQGSTPTGSSYITYSMSVSSSTCGPGGMSSYTTYSYSNYHFVDAFGVNHTMGVGGGSVTVVRGDLYCPPGGTYPSTTPWSGGTGDGSGYQMYVSPGQGSISAWVVASNGNTVYAPVSANPSGQQAQGSFSSTDRNGNQITASGGVFTDTLGTTALTISGQGTPASPTNFTYTAPSGASASYAMSYIAYTVATNFAVSGINEYGATAANLVDRITLPDNSFYQFAYEQTPSTPLTGACTPLTGTYQSYCVTARIRQVTFPTGGTINYTYTGGAGTNGSGIFGDGSAATLTRTTPDGTWTYAQTKATTGAASATLLTAPRLSYDSAANQSILQFQGIYETQRDVYQGLAPIFSSLPIAESTLQAANLMQETQSCYNGSASPCTTAAVALPITQRSEIIQLGTTTTQRKHVRFWNSFGMPTEADDYDYASGAPGPLLRQTLITYANLGSNLNAFTQTVTVKDGSGTIKSRQDNNYDQYSSFTGSNCITGAPQHDDSGHGCSFTARANATSVTAYTNPAVPSGGITQNFTYDSLGNLRTATDALNNATTLAYSPDAWANTACPPSATTYAFPVSASNALSQTTSFTYFACSGQFASVKDPNNLTAGYTYDSLLRPTQTNFPDGGQTTITYNSPTSITATTKMTSSQNIVSTVLLDGLGRTIHTQINSDPQGVDYVDTTYDVAGRVASVSNPYRSITDATYGLTSYQYDALSRRTLVIPSDGTSSANNISATYTNNVTTVTDQAGKKRQTTADALGRLTQVTEDPGGLGYVTTYSYDALSNFINVVQNGSRQRTYTYDALSRLVCESNPEIQIATCPNPDNGSYTTGTIRYGYDNNSNLTSRQAPAPNQTGAATVTTTLAYDQLNRITQKSFSDTTPTVKYGYDAVAPPGCTLPTLTINNGIGQRTGMCDAAGAEAWSYDITANVGWKITDARTTNGVPKSTIVQNNLVGSAATLTFPSGRIITYAYDAAARPVSAIDSTGPINYATAATYVPPGGLFSFTDSTSIVSTYFYNNRLQPCRISVKNTGSAPASCTDTATGNVLDFSYNFGLGSSDNGNVTSITNNRDTTRSQSFSYDSLNRTSTAKTASTSGTTCWDEQFGYDPWGNLLSIGRIPGYTCSNEELLSVTATTQNQISGNTYDAAGNLINDGLGHAYTYNAENQLLTAGGVTYTYDGDGKRVQKSSGKLYWYGMGGDPLDETDLAGNTDNASFNEYIFFSAKRIARRDSLNNVNYYFADHLGTARIVANSSGTPVDDSDFYPFGGERVYLNSTPQNYKFTGLERDSEYGLDHTWFRQYSSSLGRWMRPDPAGLAAADPSNPQSWNRYSYVLNSPLNLVDPLGLDDCLGGEHMNCVSDWFGPGGGGFGMDLFGGSGGDPLGCGWADFWGGDCRTENRMYLRAIGVVSSFDIAKLANIAYVVFPIVDARLCWSCPPKVIYPFAGLEAFLGYDNIGRGGGNSGSTVRATPKLKFKPPSWENFTHEFLPCYGAQLIDNFVGNKGKAAVTAGTVALTVKNPWIGAPLLVVWTGINAFKAGSACAVASRGYYE